MPDLPESPIQGTEREGKAAGRVCAAAAAAAPDKNDPTYLPLDQILAAQAQTSDPDPEEAMKVKRLVTSTLVAQLLPGFTVGSFDVYDNWHPDWYLVFVERLTGVTPSSESSESDLGNDVALDVFGAATGAGGSGISVIAHSVVRSMPATEAAF